jgi:hypothetical protein
LGKREGNAGDITGSRKVILSDLLRKNDLKEE